MSQKMNSSSIVSSHVEYEKQKICTRCILPESIPGIKFDANGVCNFCLNYDEKEKHKGKEDFEKLEARMIEVLREDPRKHPYDCICLYSGGKDSTYMLDQLVNKHKLRVLAFTFDNWFIPRETYENINRVAAKAECDYINFRPSWKLNKSMFQMGFNETSRLEETKRLAYLIGHACWPCFVQIAMHSIKFAVDKNIPNIVVGTTPGQIRQKKLDLTSKFGDLADVYKSMVVPMLKLLKLTKQKETLQALDMPFWSKLKVLRLKLIPFYENVHYNEEHVIKIVEEKFGWRRPGNVDSCSSNCQLNSLGIEVHKNNYGISPYVIPLARDVREGLVKREDALKTVGGKLNANLVNHIADKFDVELGV